MHIQSYPDPQAPHDWSPRHIARVTAPILDRLTDAESQREYLAAAEVLAARAAALRKAQP